MSGTTPIPLWQQLQQAAAVVQGVLAGSSATALLDKVDAALRPGVQAIAYAALRQLGWARWVRGQLVPKAPPAALDALLCTALALAAQPEAVGSEDASLPIYTDFTLVNQAVEAAKRHKALRHQAGLVNGVLRRFLREREALQTRCREQAPLHDPVLLNVPAWWWQRLQKDHLEQARAIVHAGQQTAPMTLRVNRQHHTPQAYLQGPLQAAGMQGQLQGEDGIVLAKPVPVQQLPGFDAGRVSVQDAAAQLAAPLLLQALAQQNPQRKDWRVLDACAAPGGKTAHLLERGVADVTALEVDATRAQKLQQTLQRVNLQADVQVADAALPADWWDGRPFDGILLDAPCTASGIVRRHPDIVWLRRAEDVQALAAQQRALLDALWPLVAAGGVLLYCTCSVFRAEGEDQAASFLLRHSDAARLPAPGHLLPCARPHPPGLGDNGIDGSGQTPAAPPLWNHDGFFHALFAKSA
ncbi:MAG: 16S rRNA (cytosine(967)-C(5))-methyltransferase RsmB [Brachymonas sp.]|nr:16S rRNA (cytosine(967)-C(5))-methyltransferase RsmB [Brachymonas sp.]